MKNHFTDRELLDAHFKLCSNAQAHAIAAHMGECAECRSRANALKRKFASLDLLRGDVSASEQLVAETLRQIRNEPEPYPAFLPRLGWLAGLAAAAAVLLVLLYVGPITSHQTQLAMTKTPPAPVVQVAMRQEAPEEMKAEEMPADNEKLAEYTAVSDKDMNAPSAEVRVADTEAEAVVAEPKPASGGGFALGRSALAMKASRSFAAAPAAAPQPVQTEWSVDAPDHVTVFVNPALVEFDDAVQKLKKGDGMIAQQYSVQVVNASANAVTARLARSFSATNWSVSVGDDAVRVSTRNERNVELSIEAPAQSTKSFYCTVILPAEPAKGVTP